MKNWADAKRFIFEDLIVYSVILVTDLIFDFLLNLAYVTKIYINPHELLGHPYELGFVQWVVLLFCVIQIIRKFQEWRYWR